MVTDSESQTQLHQDGVTRLPNLQNPNTGEGRALLGNSDFTTDGSSRGKGSSRVGPSTPRNRSEMAKAEFVELWSGAFPVPVCSHRLAHIQQSQVLHAIDLKLAFQILCSLFSAFGSRPSPSSAPQADANALLRRPPAGSRTFRSAEVRVRFPKIFHFRPGTGPSRRSPPVLGPPIAHPDPPSMPNATRKCPSPKGPTRSDCTPSGSGRERE